MKDYQNFPPFEFLKKVLINCAQSSMIYIDLWKQKKSSIRLSIYKPEVKKTFLTSPTLFRNRLLSLARLGLLTFEETPEEFLIYFYE